MMDYVGFINLVYLYHINVLDSVPQLDNLTPGHWGLTSNPVVASQKCKYGKYGNVTICLSRYANKTMTSKILLNTSTSSTSGLDSIDFLPIPLLSSLSFISDEKTEKKIKVKIPGVPDNFLGWSNLIDYLVFL